MSEFITIRTYDNSVSANIELARLKAEDIQCYLADENMVNTNWLYSNLVGGIKLRVYEHHVDQAIEILNDTDVQKRNFGESPELENVPVCPMCGSDNIKKGYYPKAAWGWSWLLLGIPLAFKSNKHKCYSCDYTWNMNQHQE